MGRVFVYLPDLLLFGLLAAGSCLGNPSNSLTEESYKQLARVHELMERKKYAQALTGLDSLRLSTRQDKYATALVLQTYAYLYAEMGKTELAITAIEQSMAMQSLPHEALHKLRYLSAQLHLNRGDDTGALTYLSDWFAEERAPSQEAHMLAARIYENLGDVLAAINHLERAMNQATPVQETTLRQLSALYLQVGRGQDAAAMLTQLIECDGGRADDWWRLSAVYRDLGEDRMALVLLLLAEQRGLLQKEANYLALVNYCLYLDLPYKAAKLLDTAMQRGQVAKSSEHWALLADAWAGAKETAKAIMAINRAVSLTDDPALHLKRARLAAAIADWEQVLRAVEDMLRHPSPGQSGEAHLLAGIAHYFLEARSEAVQPFRRAQADSGTRTQADQWLHLLSRQNQ